MLDLDRAKSDERLLRAMTGLNLKVLEAPSFIDAKAARTATDLPTLTGLGGHRPPSISIPCKTSSPLGQETQGGHGGTVGIFSIQQGGLVRTC